jgi:TolB-like protein/tetratricopeptide (TPR) repeat protein
MANPVRDLGNFFDELKRRKVIRVAIVYGIVAFAVIQVADIMIPALNLPGEFITFVVVATLLGYPIAIVLAWSYDIIPDAGAQQGETVAQPESSTQAASSGGSRAYPLIIIVVIIAGAAVGWMHYRTTNSVPAARPPLAYIDSVAVMPLDNLTGNADYDHIGIGITEEIITHLARIPTLKVISRHSVQAISGQGLTIPQLANALGVRHVIEGSVRLDGNGLRITLQHINAENDAHVWAESFLGESDDVIDLQEDVARQVSSRIVRMIPGISQPNEKSHVTLGPGQKAYLRGKRWIGQRTPEGIAKAIDDFTQAINLDPGYAPAYADLASAYTLALSYRYDLGLDGYTMAARSLAMAERAIELDPNLATGYASRGLLGTLIGQPANDSAADFDRAARLQPNAASIPSWRSLSLSERGHVEEALSEAGRAVDLDPLAPGRHIALAVISFRLGRYDEAIAAARMVTTIEPRLIRGRAIEARALLLSDRADECANLALGPHRVLRATCLDAMGRKADGRAIVAEVLSDLRSNSMRQAHDGYSLVVMYEDLAVDYAWRGDAKKALEWAALAYGKSPVGIEIRVLESELFDPVRDDPEFARTIAEIRSGIYERVRRDSLQFR